MKIYKDKPTDRIWNVGIDLMVLQRNQSILFFLQVFYTMIALHVQGASSYWLHVPTDCFATMDALQYIYFYPDLKQLYNDVHLISSRLMNP